MRRKCFYSFHYAEDATRAALVRNIGAIEGNPSASDNDWETITRGGEAAIQRWIAAQMQGRSCAVVLVGSQTATRHWVIYEIIEAWNRGLGVAGIRIHGLKNLAGYTSHAGANPFDQVFLDRGQTRLSTVVPLYDPPGFDSKARYGWIADNLAGVIEQGIALRLARS